MLVLRRRTNERLVIYTSDGPIVIKASEHSDSIVKFAIQAPDSIRILREELLTRDQLEAIEAM